MGRMPPLPTSEELGAPDEQAARHEATGPTLGSDLLAVVARINRLATQRVRLPVPYAQGRLLSTIEDQGEARISDLAALDHCSQPTMTTQVRRLEDAGYVSRTVDPDDARAVLIRITPAGVQALKQVRADRGAAIDPYLERLDDADRQTLADAVVVMRRLMADAAAPQPKIAE
jgi:DNA-binding MarR family transcriptional regulator